MLLGGLKVNAHQVGQLAALVMRGVCSIDVREEGVFEHDHDRVDLEHDHLFTG